MKNLLLFASILSFSFIFNSCSGDSSAALCNGDILIPFQEDVEKKWGFINLEGKIIIEPEFSQKPSYAINGIGMIEDDKKGVGRIFHFIKIEGDKAIESDDYWEVGGMFKEGLAPVRKDNEKISFINDDYETVLTVDAERVGYFNNGLAKIMNAEDKWGFINKKGEEVIAPKYNSVVQSFNSDGYAIVTEISGEEDRIIKYKIIDKSGEVKLDLKDKYDGVYGMSEGLIMVQKDGLGFINILGEKIIKTNEDWENVTLFRNGYASFEEDNEWGLMDMEGNELIKPKYKNPLAFENGMSWALNDDNEWGLIDLEDNDLIKFQYETKKEPLPFFCSSTIIEDGRDSWVFIDAEGKEINKFEYENVLIDALPYLIQDSPWEQVFKSDYFDPSIATNLFDYNKLISLQNGKEYVDFLLAQGPTKDELLTYGDYRNINFNNEYNYEDGTYSYQMYVNGSKDRFDFKDKLKDFEYPKFISSIIFDGYFSDNYAVSKVYSSESGMYRSINETYPEYYDDESERKVWLSNALKNINGNAGAELNRGTIAISLNGRGAGNGNLVAKDIARLIKMQDAQEFDKNNSYVKQGKLGDRYVVVSGSGNNVAIEINTNDIFRDFDALNDDLSYFEEDLQNTIENYYDEDYYDEDYYAVEEVDEATSAVESVVDDWL